MKIYPVSYWTIVGLSNPYCVTFKMNNGTVMKGYCQLGELPKEYYPTTEPSSIIGYDPETGVFGYTFGGWEPVSTWLSRKEK